MTYYPLTYSYLCEKCFAKGDDKARNGWAYAWHLAFAHRAEKEQDQLTPEGLARIKRAMASGSGAGGKP